MCAPVSFKVSRKHLLRRLFCSAWHHVCGAAWPPSVSPIFQIMFPFQKVGGKREQRKKNKSSDSKPANVPTTGGEAGFRPAWTTPITQRQRCMEWRRPCSATADGRQLGWPWLCGGENVALGLCSPMQRGNAGCLQGEPGTGAPHGWEGGCACDAYTGQQSHNDRDRYLPPQPRWQHSPPSHLSCPQWSQAHVLCPQASDGRSRVAHLFHACKKTAAWALWAERCSPLGCLAARLSDAICVFPGVNRYQHWLYTEGPGSQREHLRYLGLPSG